MFLPGNMFMTKYLKFHVSVQGKLKCKNKWQGTTQQCFPTIANLMKEKCLTMLY